jgi:hypothetical protein
MAKEGDGILQERTQRLRPNRQVGRWAGGPVIRITMSHKKLCPVHRSFIAMSGSGRLAGHGQKARCFAPGV